MNIPRSIVASYLPRLILGAVACIAAALPAPAAAAAPTAKPIRFARLSLEQGLSQSTVLCAFQDSRGYIWLCTEDGLNRFDGVKFKIYKHDAANASSLPSNFVWSIDEDRAGNLWIGTDGGGLAKWERATDRFVRPAATSSAYIRTVRFDSDGALWIGTRESGLDRLDVTSGEITRFRHDAANQTSLGDDHVYALHFDRSGRMWVGTDGGVSLFETKRHSFTNFKHDPANPASLSHDRVRALLGDESGALWVGTLGGGLNRLDPKTGLSEVFRNDPKDGGSLAHNQVRSIFRDNAGRLWVGTTGGLDLFDPELRAFAHYQHDQSHTSLADNAITAMGQDRSGLMWVGTRLGGVHNWNPLSWQFGHVSANPTNPEGLASANVTAFAEDRAGRIWVGTFGGGLHVMNRVTRKMTRFANRPNDPTSISSDRITALVADHEGTMWIGTLDGGLNRFDSERGTFTSFRNNASRPDSLSADGVMTMLQDSRGALWIGTFGGGLNRLNRATGQFERFQHAPDQATSLSGDRITSLAEGVDGRLWVGTEGAGLNLFDPQTGRSERFRHKLDDSRSLPSDGVYALFVDAAGAVWVGTRAGLAVRAPGSDAFQILTTAQGLANDVVYGIRSDRQGRLWLSTNNGLSAFDPRTKAFRNYGTSHGLQGSEFNFGASYQSPSGELFFGGVNGFNAFFPDRLQHNKTVPPVVLTQVTKNYKALDGPAEQITNVHLGFRDRILVFEFAALDYTAPSHNRIAYQLKGFDQGWVEAEGLRQVTYTQLHAGHYVFRVRAANNDGVWNEQALEVAVDVDSPPWATGWAYGGYLFLIAGLVTGATRAQQRKLEREAAYARILELRVRERTHELENANKELAKASITDSLTGLANRRYLNEYVDKEVSLLHRRYQEIDKGTISRETLDMGFMMIDLDNFKTINDSAGHAAGDEVLRQLRDILQESCGSSDIIIRWGGDEFLIVVRDTSTERLCALGDRIRGRLLGHAFDLGDGQTVHTTCSIGFASYPFHRECLEALSWEQVVGVADRALYVAKASGRNMWVGFSTNPETPVTGLFPGITNDPSALVEMGQLNVWKAEGAGPLVWK